MLQVHNELPYARKLVQIIICVRNASSGNNFGIRNVRFPHFRSHNYTYNMATCYGNEAETSMHLMYCSGYITRILNLNM